MSTQYFDFGVASEETKGSLPVPITDSPLPGFHVE